MKIKLLLVSLDYSNKVNYSIQGYRSECVSPVEVRYAAEAGVGGGGDGETGVMLAAALTSSVAYRLVLEVSLLILPFYP